MAGAPGVWPQTMQWNIGHRVLTIALSIPAQGAAWFAERVGAADTGQRIKLWMDGVPTGADSLTALLWVLILWRAIQNPAFGAADSSVSWGRPTSIGAWALHLATTIGGLLVVSVMMALTRGGSRRSHPRSTAETIRWRQARRWRLRGQPVPKSPLASGAVRSRPARALRSGLTPAAVTHHGRRLGPRPRAHS